MLLERGAVIDIQTNRGDTQLHRAARLGNVEIVRLYLKHGADPLRKVRPGDYHDNPSLIAVLSGRFEVIELLSKWDGGYLKQYLEEDNVKRFLYKYKSTTEI